MSDKLNAIRDAASDNFSKLFSEAIPEIEGAMIAAVDEAQANDTEAKLSIGFTIKLNLDKNSLQYRLAFSVPHKFDSCEPMPEDPNQGRLPLEPGSVTPEQAKDALKMVKGGKVVKTGTAKEISEAIIADAARHFGK